MKKLISLVLCFVLLFVAVGCGASDSATNDAAPEAIAQEVDIDLTELSATMVYSEVFNMMTACEDYVDKTIKMEGQFAVYQDEETGEYHYGCIIQDATACCAQGIEFIPFDNLNYPDDFPAEGENICVVGVFEFEEEGMYRYCFLKDAEMI